MPPYLIVLLRHSIFVLTFFFLFFVFFVQDPWKEVRSLVDGFNLWRKKVLEPGAHVVVDEVMCAWRGADAEYNADGAPHVTKIIRKPEGVGIEMKAMADGETGIIMQLDIMEGKVRQRKKDFYNETQSEGAAVILRLMKHWLKSFRVVHADSAFSSVLTLMHLRRYCLHFMGIVKTAHREFPLKYLLSRSDEFTGHNRGGHILLQSSKDSNGLSHPPIYALAWYDRKAKCIVSSCGSTRNCAPYERNRHKKAIQDGVFVTIPYKKYVKQPELINTFFSCFHKIDVNDHMRQGSLALEKSWLTHKWYIRFFTSIYGICVVDAYLAYRYDAKMHFISKPMSFTDFCYELAFSLVKYCDRPTGGSSAETQEVSSCML